MTSAIVGGVAIAVLIAAGYSPCLGRPAERLHARKRSRVGICPSLSQASNVATKSAPWLEPRRSSSRDFSRRTIASGSGESEARFGAQRKQDMENSTAFVQERGRRNHRTRIVGFGEPRASGCSADEYRTLHGRDVDDGSLRVRGSIRKRSVGGRGDRGEVATAAEIGRQIEGSSKVAKEAVDQANSTDQSMARLAVAADKVGSIVKLITAIVEHRVLPGSISGQVALGRLQSPEARGRPVPRIGASRLMTRPNVQAVTTLACRLTLVELE